MKSRFHIIFITVALAIFLAAAVVCNVSAATIYVYQGFSYFEVSDGEVSVCGWDDSSEELVIPSTLLGDRVTNIDSMALMNDRYITSVDFRQAGYLSVIGNNAFRGCSGLTGTLLLPSGLSRVGNNAFQECTGIERLLYYAAKADIPSQLCYGCTSLSEVIISDGVTAISSYAFAGCSDLSLVRIPDSVESIHNTAFDNCPSLVIYCYTDSYAQQYAIDNGIEYVLIDAPDPTEPPTEPDTQEPTHQTIDVTFILGDADGDGFITIIDATKVQRVLADLDDDIDGMITLRAAVDGDVLNIMHATKIQRYLAEFEVAEPIGEEVTRTVTI